MQRHRSDRTARNAKLCFGGAGLIIALASLGCAHTVQVMTDPPGATVVVNGKEIGQAPVYFEEDADPAVDEYVIVARLNGHETTERRVRRTQANPWSAIAVAPCLGSLGWLAGAATMVVGLILSPATLCVSIPAGAAGGAIFAGTGCGWMLLTSPTLLLLLNAQTLPDDVRLELRPTGSFEQHDPGTGTWPPPFLWSPEEEGYWQNPAPEEASEALPPPTGEPGEEAASAPASAPHADSTSPTPSASPATSRPARGSDDAWPTSRAVE